MLKKASIFLSVVKLLLKSAYSAKLKEYQLNKSGKDIFISHSFLFINTDAEGHNRFYANGRISNSKIGAFSYLQYNCNVSNAVIGRFCSIGPSTIIAHGEHPTDFVSTHPLFYNDNGVWGIFHLGLAKFEYNKPVSIGSDVWIGANCYIRNGVNIGTGCIIATGSVVTKNVEPYSIVGGVPAKVIRKRFSEDAIKKLLDSEWWSMELNKLKSISQYFTQPMNEATINSFVLAVSNAKMLHDVT